MSSVSDCVSRRFSCRSFSEKNPDLFVVKSCLYRALQSPSSFSMFPYKVYVVTGTRLKKFLKKIQNAKDLFPYRKQKAFPYPYRYRKKMGTYALYKSLNIQEDKRAQKEFFFGNFSSYKAPVICFVARDNRLDDVTFIDIGIYVQTLCLLLEENGLNSIIQGFWSQYSSYVCSYLRLPLNDVIILGVGIGTSSVPCTKREKVFPRDVIRFF